MQLNKDTQSPPSQESLGILPNTSLDVDLCKEFDLVESLLKQPANDNDRIYLVPATWIEMWEKYVQAIKNNNYDADPPGRIDTSVLLTSDGALKPNLYAPHDFRTAPQNAWEILLKRYGVYPSEIARGMFLNDEGKIEPDIYPVEYAIYLVFDHGDNEGPSRPPPKISMYKSSTVSELKFAVERALKIPSCTSYSLWVMSHVPEKDKDYVPPSVLKTSYRVAFQDDTMSIASLIITGADLAVDLNKSTPSTSPSAYEHVPIFGSEIERMEEEEEEEELLPLSSEQKQVMVVKENVAKYEPGYCGLWNMGNTCYMNSALQCLSNTFDLTRYFLDQDYLHDINIDNPLGMKGELASAYGELIEAMWSGTKSSITPQKFKPTIARFNSTFSGYRQHDSQELLSFLLDGLHEDLNRIKKKPYIELPDFDDMPDSKVAEKCWLYHKERNDSIVVDLFQGQFKSRLVCSECGKVSIMFDPFMYLSLPLPVQKTIHLKVIFVPYNPEARQKRIVLTFKNIASIEQAKAQVAEKTGIDDPSTLLVLEIFDHSIYKIFANYELISNEMADDLIYVYQMPGSIPPPPTDRPKKFKQSHGSSSFGDNIEDSNPTLIIFPVYFCTMREDSNKNYNSRSSRSSDLEQFGFPVMLGIAPEDASDPSIIYKLIVQHIERFAAIRLVEEIGTKTTVLRVSPTPDDMDIDEDTVENGMAQDDKPVQRSVHTSAAVTAAGGRPVKLMSNLFTMKVFSDDGFLPTGSPLSSSMGGLYDLTESRNNRGWGDSQSPLPPLPMDHTLEDDSVEATPTTPMDEQVINKETEVSHSFPAASTSPRGSSSRSSLRQPPQTVIKQGEGIVTVWTTHLAQTVFVKDDRTKTSTFDEIDEDTAAMDILSKQQQQDQQMEKKVLSLYDCLKEFVREEVLGQNDLWYCPRCKKHQDAKKKIDLWFMPEILVVHLKRFSNSRVLRDKVDVFVDFPIESLDLTDIVASCVEDRELLLGNSDRMEEEQVIYDLYAVDNHYGGMGGGHYTAFAQSPKTKEWLKFNDDSVNPVTDLENIKTSAAYLLFYKRRHTSGTSQPSPPSPQEILSNEQWEAVAATAANKAEDGIVC